MVLRGNVDGTPLGWTGGCGAPEPATDWVSATVFVFPGEPPSITVLVPLANGGSASLDGTTSGAVTDAGGLVAAGQWTVPWCGEVQTARAVGPGEVRVRWAIDPATRRHWPAPKRGAL
ncbi:MAG: hypothetical protein ABMA64_27125 [Myxococcota bacterium]